MKEHVRRIIKLLLPMCLVMSMLLGCTMEILVDENGNPVDESVLVEEDSQDTSKETEEEEEEEVNLVVKASSMSEQMNRWNVEPDGLYFCLWANEVPYGADWDVEYIPTTPETVKVVRDGVTYNVGNPAAGTLVKYSNTEYFLKFEKWVIGEEVFPIQDGDVIIVEGDFVAKDGSGWTLSFEPNYCMVVVSADLTRFSTNAADFLE